MSSMVNLMLTWATYLFDHFEILIDLTFLMNCGSKLIVPNLEPKFESC